MSWKPERETHDAYSIVGREFVFRPDGSLEIHDHWAGGTSRIWLNRQVVESFAQVLVDRGVIRATAAPVSERTEVA
jgi:hypothetical protein